MKRVIDRLCVEEMRERKREREGGGGGGEDVKETQLDRNVSNQNNLPFFFSF